MVREPDDGEGVHRPLVGLDAVDPAKPEDELDVLPGGQHPGEARGLPDDADVLAPERGACVAIEAGQHDAADRYLAIVRRVEPGEQREQRRLARARGPVTTVIVPGGTRRRRARGRPSPNRRVTPRLRRARRRPWPRVPRVRLTSSRRRPGGARLHAAAEPDGGRSAMPAARLLRHAQPPAAADHDRVPVGAALLAADRPSRTWTTGRRRGRSRVVLTTSAARPRRA
jgi:hypothetical protein